MMCESIEKQETDIPIADATVRKRGRPRVNEEKPQKVKEPKPPKPPKQPKPPKEPKPPKPPKPVRDPLEFKSKRPNYAAEYYREKYACPERCPYCVKEVIKQKISRHIQNTQKCLMLRMQRELEILRKETAESQQ